VATIGACGEFASGRSWPFRYGAILAKDPQRVEFGFEGKMFGARASGVEISVSKVGHVRGLLLEGRRKSIQSMAGRLDRGAAGLGPVRPQGEDRRPVGRSRDLERTGDAALYAGSVAP